MSTEQPGDQPDDQGMPTRRGRKDVHWRKDAAILERMRKVEMRHLAKWSNVAIAAELEIDESTVRRDIVRLNELWRERLGDDVIVRRARRLAQIDDVIARGLDAAESAEDARGKAAALQVSRQGIMDAAKLEGLVIDKVMPSDDKGELLRPIMMIEARQQAAPELEAEDDGRAAG